MAHALLEMASTAHGDWTASLRHVVQLDSEVLEVERVSFWSLGDNPRRLHCDAGYVVSSRSFERGAALFEADHGAYLAAIREMRILSIEDVLSDARTRSLLAYSAIRGIASMLNVPVWVDGRLAGVLCHEHVGEQRRWRPAEEDFAAGAGQVVASILAARAQTVAESAARRAAFLDSVSCLILPSLDTREIAGRVVGLVVPGFADFAIIWVRNRDGVIEPLASTHVEPGMRGLVAEAARAALDQAPPPGLTYVMAQGQSLLYPELSPSVLQGLGDAQEARARDLGVRTAMIVPLALAGKTLGAMAWFASNRNYRGEDLGLAEAVAVRIAAALENAHLYEMARQAIDARDEFLILAAHELRTPLTALQLYAHDVPVRGSLRGPAGETSRSAALGRQVRRLAMLVERLCDVAGIRAEGLTLAREWCDLAAIVRERGAVAAQRARRGGSAIGVRAESPVLGRWDRARMAQVVDELLDNAIKFGKGRPIEMTLYDDGECTRLTVRDHGGSIPADRLASIFSPFERAVTREHYGGLGLGLHLAKAIVEAHGGSIEATSRPGQGTAIVAQWPPSPGGPGSRGGPPADR
jgi:signal transduction histidine kinase